MKDMIAQRHRGLQKIVTDIRGKYGLRNGLPLRETIECSQSLASFEFFDQLAGATRTPEEVVPIVQKSIMKMSGLDK